MPFPVEAWFLTQGVSAQWPKSLENKQKLVWPALVRSSKSLQQFSSSNSKAFSYSLVASMARTAAKHSAMGAASQWVLQVEIDGCEQLRIHV